MRDELIYKLKNITTDVISWAFDRNLLLDDNSEKQYLKLIEEFGELVAGCLKQNKSFVIDSIGDMMVVMAILKEMKGYRFNFYELDYENYFIGESKVTSALRSTNWLITTLWDLMQEDDEKSIEIYYTEILAYLHFISNNYGMCIEDCYQIAYDEIKNRKGVMLNGTFVRQ